MKYLCSSFIFRILFVTNPLFLHHINRGMSRYGVRKLAYALHSKICEDHEMRTEDGYFISKCLNGDPAAFGFLVDKYKACVYALAYTRLRNFHDAEDATQDVFLTAYRKLNTLKRYDNFRAWLYSITSNHCKMLLRSQANRPDNEFIEDQTPEVIESPSIDSHRESLANEVIKELTEKINQALGSLPEAYSQVLTLRYLGGMSNDEIAEFLGISQTAIRQRLSRARAELREGCLQ